MFPIIANHRVVQILANLAIKAFPRFVCGRGLSNQREVKAERKPGIAVSLVVEM